MERIGIKSLPILTHLCIVLATSNLKKKNTPCPSTLLPDHCFYLFISILIYFSHSTIHMFQCFVCTVYDVLPCFLFLRIDITLD